MFKEDYDDTNNMNIVEEQRVKGTRVSGDQAEVIHMATYSLIDLNWDPDLFDKYFDQATWKKTNLHECINRWL